MHGMPGMTLYGKACSHWSQSESVAGRSVAVNDTHKVAWGSRTKKTSPSVDTIFHKDQV